VIPGDGRSRPEAAPAVPAKDEFSVEGPTHIGAAFGGFLVDLELVSAGVAVPGISDIPLVRERGGGSS